MASKTLTAVFKAVDQMSNVMDKVANGADKMVSKFDNTTSSANNSFNAVVSGSEKAAQSINQAATATDFWTDKLGNYDKSAMLATFSVEELVEQGYMSEEALAAQASAAEDAADSLNNAAKKTEEVAKETDKATEEVEKFGDSSAQSFGELESLLASAGIGISLLAIGAAFMEAGRAAGEFETRIAAIATVADTSQASIGQITSDIMTLSRDTGQSAIELGKATYDAISASVDTANAVSFVADANKLAVGGFTSSAMATDILTTSINAYGLAAEDASRISDVLITTQNLGKTVVDELAQSMGRVIPTAAAFNVDMENLSSAFAITTSNGIKTAEAGTYINQMLVELGMASSNVSGVLMDETGMAFAQLMEQGNSLGDVLQIIKDSVDGDTTAFRNLWGSATAGAAALSLLNGGSEKYNSTLGAMQNSAGATSKAYEIMAGTTDFAAKKMSNSFENLKIAVGEGFNSLMKPIYEVGSAAMDALSGFMNEYPAVAQAITALAIGLGVATTAITIYTVVTKLATAATGALGVSVAAVLWPIAAVTAAVAGVIMIMDHFNNLNEEYNELASTSKANYNELERLNAEHEKYVASGEGASEAARNLENSINDLTTAYENNRMTMSEFLANQDALASNHESMMQNYSSTTNEMGTQLSGTIALVDELRNLSSASDNVTGAQERMKSVLDEVNNRLGTEYNVADLLNTGNFAEIEEAANAVAEATEKELAFMTWTQAKAETANLTKARDDAARELEAGAKLLQDEMSKPFANLMTIKDRYDELQTLQAESDRAAQNLQDNADIIAECDTKIQGYTASVDEAAAAQDALTQGQTAASETMSGIADEVVALTEAYDQAFASARSALDGAFGMFDKVEIKPTFEIDSSVIESEVTGVTDTIKARFDEQATAFNEYRANLESAMAMGVDKNLLSQFADGTPESMGNLQAIVGELEKLKETGGNVQGAVNDINGSFAGLNTAKNQTANVMAEIQTDFSTKMDAILSKTQDTISGLKLDSDAAAAAQATVDAYIRVLNSGVDRARRTASSISAAARSGFNTMGIPVAGNALGTTNAEDVFVAGERGPELIVGHQGSTVFPTSETDRIISALGNREFNVAPSGGFAASAQSEPMTVTNNNNKVITLNLQGGGKISVPRGASKKEILAIMQDNIRPVLIDLLEEELFTEGDGTYDY